MSSEIIYILTTNRSGSTLLDQLISSNSNVTSVGELHHLEAYVLEDRALYNPDHELVCACGSTVSNCSYWQNAASFMGRGLDDLQVALPRTVVNAYLYRIITRWPRLIRAGLRHCSRGSKSVVKDRFELTDALAATNNVRYVVDSSKDLRMYLLLAQHRPDDVKLVLLSRDPRAVIHSMVRRGRTLEWAARSWTAVHEAMEKIEKIAPASVRVKYEELCDDPDKTMATIHSFLGLKHEPFHRARSHHIGGSASKFDAEKRSIALDKRYLSAFSKEEVDLIRKIALPTAQRWGYWF